MPEIRVRVKEHYGDEERPFGFPDGWDVDVVKMNNHDTPSLSKDQIGDALDHTIGSKTITELARGKRGRIVILHDDLTRPTPAYQIVPSIIDKLHEARIEDSQIFFLAALGSHPPMSIDAIGRKIGYDTIQKYDIRNHVVFDTRNFGAHNFVDKGFTSFGTPVKINWAFAKADVRIAVSGLIKKRFLGCGGGGKICMPGIASLEAIKYNHTVVSQLRDRSMDPQAEASAYWNIKHNAFRRDMQEFARIAGLDFLINVVSNGNREATGVFAGDLDEAYMEGVRSCYESHSTKVPNKKFDIVVACSYPQAGNEGLRWCDGANDILRDAGTAVNICISPPEGYYLTHYLSEAVGGVLLKFLKQERARQWPIEQAEHVIVLDDLMDMHERIQFDERVEFVDKWASVIRRLREIHGDKATVAVFPTAAFQFNPNKYPLMI